ncbi:MAG: hypothetical protein OEU68_00035 [Nitrospira sp.]|nr:hypothetical protein [Nitrospira sp.]MDH4243765.1 hypothetical protein [Nitrospira sp.]MDH4356431.1 hypothetical protein [Nitrospira sp.]MDH5318787.1 hypothetical protein [Nitrospira sp.]
MGHSAQQPSWHSERRFVKVPTALDFTFVETDQLEEWISTSSSYPLALISFGASIPNLPPSVNCPTLSIDLPQLTEPARVEVWASAKPVRMIRNDNVSVAMNGEVAAAFLSVKESAGVALEITTYHAYRSLLSELRELGYPYLWRAWNYFPAINDQESGLERYQRFCIGRHQALLEALPDFPASLPAATAVGTASGPLQVYALAGIYPARHLGNPRQVHAYEYPESYGPRSPSFSRATIAQVDGSAQLFLAGTASVVGHASRHVDSSKAQARETLENIQTLLSHAQATSNTGSFVDPGNALYKVYVRDAGDLGEIRQVIENTPLVHTQIFFLHGHLCRRELLVEIEAIVTSDSGSACCNSSG